MKYKYYVLEQKRGVLGVGRKGGGVGEERHQEVKKYNLIRHRMRYTSNATVRRIPMS